MLVQNSLPKQHLIINVLIPNNLNVYLKMIKHFASHTVHNVSTCNKCVVFKYYHCNEVTCTCSAVSSYVSLNIVLVD